MGSTISKIADEIKLHGSYEAYIEFRDLPENASCSLPGQRVMPFFPDPEEVKEKPNSVSSQLTKQTLISIKPDGEGLMMR